MAGAVAVADATVVRFTARSAAANDVDNGNCDVAGGRSFGGWYKHGLVDLKSV
jgi:hypothetical protein